LSSRAPARTSCCTAPSISLPFGRAPGEARCHAGPKQIALFCRLGNGDDLNVAHVGLAAPNAAGDLDTLARGAEFREQPVRDGFRLLVFHAQIRFWRGCLRRSV